MWSSLSFLSSCRTLKGTRKRMMQSRWPSSGEDTADQISKSVCYYIYSLIVPSCAVQTRCTLPLSLYIRIYSWLLTTHTLPHTYYRLLLVRLSSLITLIAVILIQIQCTQPFPEQKGTQCSVDFSLSGLLNSTELNRNGACPIVSHACMHALGCGWVWSVCSPTHSCRMNEVLNGAIPTTWT